MTRRIRAAFFVLLAALVLLGGASAGLAGRAAAQEPTPTPEPIVTGNIPVIAISPELCFLLTAARPGETLTAPSCQQFDTDPGSVLRIAELFGNGDGRIQPEDFTGIDLDGNQLHQLDDFVNNTSNNGSLWIIAFVADGAPVTFKTDRGLFVPPNSPGPGVPHPSADDVDNEYYCDMETGQVSPATEDADCADGGAGGDGVVVARLRSRYGSKIADIGPGTVTIKQEHDQATIKFRVVGEPWSLSFTTLESKIQNGLSNLATECPLPGDAAGFLGANGTAERSIVLAIARDHDGNAVTGAIINWKTDDPHKAAMATGLTPTLDLGAFGFGAPNIICGTRDPGTVTVTADISRDINLGTTHVGDADPEAYPDKNTVKFNVVGVPASMTLIAAPSELTCDGVASSTVSATVLDAAGTLAAAGQRFNSL